MKLPRPEPGLVIPYSYLWRDEHRRGHDEGRKDRPCVIVIAVETVQGAPRVTVVPITHSPPARPASAIELPPRIKEALGLDDQRSWVVLEEANRFLWPGYDLRPVAGKRDRFDYGFVPPRFFDRIVVGFLSEAAQQRGALVPRD